MSNYLDSTGLAYFWGKIKARLNQKADYEWTEKSPTGSFAQFEDGVGGTLYSGLVAAIEPGIGRKGTVGPTNPRPLSGHTTIGVHGSGKNLFDKTRYTKMKISCTATSGATTGTVAGVNQEVAWMQLPGGVTYAVSCSTHSTTAFRVTATAEYPVSTNDYKTPILLTISDTSASEIIFAAPEGTRWIGFTLRTNSATDVTTIDDAVEGLQVEVASAATEYEAFQGGHLDITVPSAVGTLYAGTLDVIKGTLEVTHLFVQFDGTETWSESTSGTYPYYYTTLSPPSLLNNGSGWSSHFPWALIRGSSNTTGIDVINGAQRMVAVRPESSVANTLSGFTTWLASQASAGTPLQVVYPILAPVVYQVAGSNLSALEGVNRVWCDNGGLSLKYVTGLQAAVKNGDDGLRSMIASGESAMAASKNYTEGERFAVGNVLYKATANIASGEALVPGTNVTATTIADELNAILPATGVSF